ncbi:zinc finger CCCH domain-containing protein 10-like isoform X3 [Adelges cooleyi]|uniref:zinc finger CCCH domain-containing protein 10-like isoform X3 n=1 Tax=Adelges cooleyi TaxID=133065 RepID=UPI002180816E|nr:zinc finger CCCH domain-containing protein 10-like isoform X3 [Adelges cooleyi]
MKGKKDLESDTPDNVCRDFMRNVCNRGKSCKFFHPPIEEDKRKYVFCHDFQNGKCSRHDCRFIHCSREDEEYYNQTGRMAPDVLRTLEMSGAPSSEDIPICKDYLKGNCHRSQAHCKFRHVDQPHDIPVRGPSGPYNAPQPPTMPPNFGNEPFRRRFEYDEEPDPKRRRYDFDNRMPLGRPFPSRDMEFAAAPPGSTQQQPYWLLQDEVEMLRKRVAELKKRNEELQATNEFLLEQNAQLRINEQAPLRSTQQMFMNNENGNITNRDLTLTKQRMYDLYFNRNVL